MDVFLRTNPRARFALHVALVVFGAGGCSSGATSGPASVGHGGPSRGDAGPSDPSDGDADYAERACTEGLASGFAKTPHAFTLPAARCGQPFDGIASVGDVRYSLLDVDADRRPDLVVTHDACAEEIGDVRWDVYPALADGSGFAKTPHAFALPAARCEQPFDNLAGTGDVRYSLLDIDADRRPDLVVTFDACDEELGTKRWDVYPALADGSGFAKTPRAFTLPAARCKQPFDNLAGTGDVRYSLLDVDADRRPDLVVTYDACDEELGTKRWDIYPALADGSGFAKTPRAFTLPAPRCQRSFDDVIGTSAVRYELRDVDADRRPDLVVTHDACDEAIGDQRWDVYRASADDSGFLKTPSPFSLPAARCNERFDASSGTGAFDYTLLDLSCDGRGDLVVSSDRCDAELGASRWEVYVASDTGFAKQPSKLALPAARCGVRFDNVGANGDVAYTLLDVSADSRVDLLVTGDACDDAIGTRRWDAYTLE